MNKIQEEQKQKEGKGMYEGKEDYEINPNVVEQLTMDVENLLSDRNYPYADDAIQAIMDTWKVQKSSLISMFSKHPNWNPNKLMIQFDEDFSRKIEYSAVVDFADWAKYNIGKLDVAFAARAAAIGELIYQASEEFFSSSLDWYIEAVNCFNPNYKLRNNMKTSKAIGKIFREEGWDKAIPEFSKHYAVYCDAISPIKVRRHTCISVNPIDFLLMSNGNSWTSCHNIDYFGGKSGCYSSGTISYMLDSTSFVFYTVDAEYDGCDIELEKKLCRQIFAYENGQIMQSRLYPQSNDSGADHLYTEIRAIVQKVISDCIEQPNLWVKVDYSALKNTVRKGHDATCYPDWRCNELCTLTRRKDMQDQNLSTMIVGAKPICISCGYPHNYEQNISCCESDFYCSRCGIPLNNDNVVWVNDQPYCSDCTFFCDRCNEFHANIEKNIVFSLNAWGGKRDEWWCDFCVDVAAKKCDDCGEYWEWDGLQELNGHYYCQDCFDGNTFICDECGTFTLNSDRIELEGKVVCPNCYYGAQGKNENVA